MDQYLIFLFNCMKESREKNIAGLLASVWTQFLREQKHKNK